MTSRLTPDQIAEALRSGRRVAPSQPDPWTGTPVAGQRFTGEQLRRLREGGHDPDRVAVREVPLEVPNRQFPLSATDTIIAHCPIIARTRRSAPRARVLIITPAGDQMWVNAAAPAAGA